MNFDDKFPQVINADDRASSCKFASDHSPFHVVVHSVDLIQKRLKETEMELGQLGMLAMKMQMKKSHVKREDYQFTLISAISQDAVIANQFV